MPPLFPAAEVGGPGAPDLPLGVSGLCDPGPYGVGGLLGGVVGDGVVNVVGRAPSVGLPDVELDAVFPGAGGAGTGGGGARLAGVVGTGGFGPMGGPLGGDPTPASGGGGVGDPEGGTSIESDAVGGPVDDIGASGADASDLTTPVQRVVRLGDGSFVF